MPLNIISKYKIAYDQRINLTPFFIWSANLKEKVINKVNSQLDILPTVLNLFGIPFQEKSMIGRDIFDKNNTPTLHSLKNNSFIFTEHYSY